MTAGTFTAAQTVVCLIAGVSPACARELVAPAVVNHLYPQLLRQRRVALLVDSEPAEGALIRGYSSKEDMCAIAGRFWEQARDLEASIWVDRVPTDGNPADGPSRGDLDTLGRRGSHGSYPEWVDLSC